MRQVHGSICIYMYIGVHTDRLIPYVCVYIYAHFHKGKCIWVVVRVYTHFVRVYIYISITPSLSQ